jgi:hypothetical protein
MQPDVAAGEQQNSSGNTIVSTSLAWQGGSNLGRTSTAVLAPGACDHSPICCMVLTANILKTLRIRLLML